MEYYKVIQETSIEKLEIKIHEFLNSDWKLQGGVCVNYRINEYNNEFFIYSQAITRI